MGFSDGFYTKALYNASLSSRQRLAIGFAASANGLDLFCRSIPHADSEANSSFLFNSPLSHHPAQTTIHFA
jgi:hypothetical protein